MSQNEDMIKRLENFRRYGSTSEIDGQTQGEDRTRAEMARNRAINRKQGALTGNPSNRSGADISFATGRPRDPLFYWRQNNLPYDFADPDELRKVRLYSRLLYLTHPMIASCVDIYSKFPLLGMELKCKDDKLTQFYTDLFLTEEGLNYEEFALDMGREYWTCALPGEQVGVASGVKAVQDVREGDHVLTHRGRLRPVVRTTVTDVETTAYTVKPRYGRPLRFTEGHRFLRRTDSGSSWVEVEHLRPRDQVFVPIDRTITPKGVMSFWETADSRHWEVYGPLVEDPSWTPRYRRYRRERQRRHDREGLVHGTVLRRTQDHRGRMSPLAVTEVPVTEDLMYLLGLYVAEGSAGRDGARWSYSWEERELAKTTADLIERIFGVSTKIDYRMSTTVVTAYNKPLGAWMGGLFGHGSTSKSLPRWLMELPLDLQAAFLRGWMVGDGHVAEPTGSQGRRWARIATASPQLMHQAQVLIRRQDIVPVTYDHESTRNGTACQWWTVGPVMGSTRRFCERLGLEIDASAWPSDSEPRHAEMAEDGYWVEIGSVLAEPYAGPVYDLTVADDHSFTASGVAVHNCGEAWPFATFNEKLGIWDSEELLNADDVEVQRSPFMKDPRYFIRLPETIRRVLNERQPAWEYAKLIQSYPELVHYGSDDARMPVSNVLLQQLRFKSDTFNPRGVPILTRAMRAAVQEEMLNSAVDAIADRLYTPLILARLGASATDLGMDQPWIPTQDQLADFEEALDAALAADFRALVYHFAVDIEPVFGREQMPDLTGDFDRLENRILQTFGLSKTMLTGADCLSGDTMIDVSRAGKGFRMTLRDLVARFSGTDDHLPGRRWRSDIPTYVSRAEGDVVRLGRLDAAWMSGVKEVFELTTETGRSIKASAEHPFLTESGEWVRLGDLSVGDRVRVNALSNLELMSQEDHLRHHSGQNVNNVLWQVGCEQIVSIESKGEEETYDLGMADDPHNFLADGFVVHNSGQTYAADALNRDLIAQLLTTYQKMVIRHYRKRALIVAEAQEHFDYEERGGKRYVITEEILEVDEETGEERIVEQPKLLIPDMAMRTMNLRDEEVERQFLESLAESGVPVSIKTRLTNIPISFEEEIERRKDEQVRLAVAEQEVRRAQYQALRDANLPIPQDLRNDFEPKPMNMPTPDSMMLRTPVMGLDPTGALPNIAPTPEDLAAVPAGQPVNSFPQAQMPGAPVIPMQPGQEQAGQPEEGSSRPAESDEQRKRMPKSSSQAELWKRAKRMREVAAQHLDLTGVEEKITAISKIVDEGERTQEFKNLLEQAEPQGGDFGTPIHIGMRKHVPLDQIEGLEYERP